MQLSDSAAAILKRLEENGYEAYAVGGCVRDSLLGLPPHDFDICTAALPEQMLAVFSDVTCIPTGLQHGTVTVVWEGQPLEITTYRTEGCYSDSRHPDRVEFVRSVEADLARRDFTVNAMAYHPQRGLVDPFGGEADLKLGLLRAVGDPTTRFTEDALRLLRALRFAACYGFELEEETARAARALAPRLSLVAAERVREELNKLLLGRYAAKILLEFREVLLPVLPELEAIFDFEQHNPHHHLDVYGHTVQALTAAASDLTVRLALLLHDIGKPTCFSRDDAGIGHFYGHAAVSGRMAKAVLERLRYDRRTVEQVCLLIRYHDVVLEPEDRLIKRWLNRFGADFLHQLLLVKAGDNLGQPAALAEARLAELEELHRRIDRIVAEAQCFSLKDLAISGRDVMALGYTGKAVGQKLQWALEAVMDNRLPNTREALLQALCKNA